VKGTRTRDPLRVAVELRADQTVRDVAMKRLDERILSVTSRDIVAAEAHTITEPATKTIHAQRNVPP